MTLDTFTWEQPGYFLIYGCTREQLWDYTDSYLARHPQTRGRVFDYITNYKKGFLQKYQTIVDVLVAQVPKKERPAFREKIERHCKDAGLGEYIYRSPKSMGGELQMAWTCLSAALQGEKKFLIRDFGTPDSCGRAAHLTAWLLDFDPAISIVWISAATEEALNWQLFPNGRTHLNRCSRLRRMENGTLAEVDTAAVQERHRARLAAEKARREAELAAKLEQTAALEEQGKFQTALDAYMALAEQGVTEAGTRAARMCMAKYKAYDSSQDWLQLATTAARTSRSPKAYILLGDQEMEFVNSRAKDAKTDDEIKGLVIFALKEAIGYYGMAATYGDAEGCFKAARLHLRYTFSKTDITYLNDGSVLSDHSYSFSHYNAVFYIKKLLAMQDAGENVYRYLLELTMMDPANYCDIARKEYQEEKG